MYKKLLMVLFYLFVATSTTYAASISGTVTVTGGTTAIEGVNVQIQGTTTGTQTGPDGRYLLEDLSGRIAIVIFSHVAHESVERRIDLSKRIPAVDIQMAPILFPGQAITVTATRAEARKTPATFSNLGEKELQDRFHT